MSERYDVSVVMSTYNRCDLLPPAVESLLAQRTDGLRYELVVVDNNSTDRTREVVESIMARGQADLRYVFEGRQGLSHGRNAGIANSTAPLVAFTDDDVRAAPDWVASVKRAFDEHPEVDFLGGKVLPRWEREPPSWLTSEIWSGPLALVDAGDEPFYSSAERVFFFPGANFAFRRSLFDRVGLFDPHFQRVPGWVSSVEDSEFILRVLRAGHKGLYAPHIVMRADVQAERMTKDYLRRWFASRGRYRAMLRLHEILGAEDQLQDAPTDALRLFGTPAHVYRDLLSAGARFIKAALTGREREAFRHECEWRCALGYVRQRYRESAAEGEGSRVGELTSFAFALMRKRVFGGRA